MALACGRTMAGIVGLALLGAGCSRGASPTAGERPATADAGPTGGSSRLTPEQAAQVLAKVGSRTITLGEYEAVLARMNRFERMRFESVDRRKELLDELINVELLAQEAERRGLDKTPEYQLRVNEILREVVLDRARDAAPKVEDIAPSEVHRYYADHRDEFREPERRRVAHLVVDSRSLAEKLMERAREADAVAWGRLVRAHSLDASSWGADVPDELVGDLGIVSALGENDQSKIPQALRKAVFSIQDLGGIFPEVIEADGGFHIVRLIGKTEARVRSEREAERAIRVAVVRKKVQEAAARLEQDLRKRFPLVVDTAALSQVKVPAPEPSSGRTAQ